MPKYRYIVKTKETKTLRDIEEASSQEEIIARLRARGLFVVSVEEVGGKEDSLGRVVSLSPFRKRKRNSIKLRDLAMLARNLSITLSSGITLLRSLEILSSQVESAGLEKILKENIRGIKEGLSLSEAFAKYPKIFSPLWQALVEVGEVSGNLPFILEKLADYLEERMDFESKIKSAMVYPIILSIAAFIAMIVFFKVILPKFTEIFTEFNVKLPLSTRILFGLSKIVDKYFIQLFLGIIFLVIFIPKFLKSSQVKKTMEEIQLTLPVIKTFVLIASLERFTSMMFILLESGLPLVSTLEVAARGIGNSLLEKGILSTRERVREGFSLALELNKLGVLPSLVVELTKVGEETGTMPDVFKKISSYYRKELTHWIERFITAFEPAMILIMGLIIGSLVISIFLPLFQLSTAGGGKL